MFGREFQAGKHRQHIVPSPPTGYGFEVIGSRKEAGFYSVALPFRVETYEEGGRFYYDLLDADDVGLAWNEAQSEEERDQQIEQSVKDWGGNLADVEGWRPRKGASRRTAQWFTNTDRMGDSYKTTFDPSRGNEFQSDEPVARVSERPRSDGKPSRWSWEIWLPGGHPMGSGGVAPAVPEFGHEETEEEALRKAEQAMPRYAFRKASRRTADHHLAFFDGFDIPEPRHRVAGWDWDDHLNGFLAAEAAREFTCACGESVPAPGYTDCRCGRRWNAYTIQANGSKKMIAREVPVRDGVVMARRTAFRKQAADYSDYSYDQLVDERDILRQQYADWEIDQSEYKDTLAEIEAEAESRGLTLASRKNVVMAGRTASRVAAYEEDDGYTSPEAGDSIEVHSGGSYFEVLYDKRIGDHKFRATNGQEFYVDSIVSINEDRVDPDKIRLEASRKQAGELWIEDGGTYFFQYDSHAGEFYAEVYPASGSYTWFLSDPSGIRTYADGYGVATVEEAKAQAEQALTKVIGSEPVVAGRKQAESGVPKFREGDMVIGRGPDMNTHTLREVGSVVEQDGGYFYRLRKLNGSGPGGQRLYAEEHLEGYRINRTSNHRTAASEEADEAARDMETYLPIVQTHTDKRGNYVFEFDRGKFIALFRNNYTKEWIVEQRSGGPDGPGIDHVRCADMATAKGRIELFTRGRPLSTI